MSSGLLTGVPFVKNSPRAPLGPSVVFIEGTPFSGMAIDRQKSAPASNEICRCQFPITIVEVCHDCDFDYADENIQVVSKYN